jgi:hypothetical protein
MPSWEWKDGKKYWDCMAVFRFTPDIDMGTPTPHCAPQGQSPARTTKSKKGEKTTKNNYLKISYMRGR